MLRNKRAKVTPVTALVLSGSLLLAGCGKGLTGLAGKLLAPSPTLTITTPSTSTATVTSVASPFAVAGACKTAGITVAYSIGGLTGTFPCTEGAWSGSISLETLNNGNYTLTLIQTDSALNEETATLSVTRAVRPTVTLAFTNLGGLQSTADVTSTPTNVTATFSTAVTGFAGTDISVGAAGTVDNFQVVSGTVYTFDVNWSASKGTISIADAAADDVNAATVKSMAASLQLVSFADNIAPLLNTRLTDGTNTNNFSCVFCHSGGSSSQRQTTINAMFSYTPWFGTASTSTTTFPKSNTNFSPSNELATADINTSNTAWKNTTLPTVEWTAVVTKYYQLASTSASVLPTSNTANSYTLVDAPTYNYNNSLLYRKVSMASPTKPDTTIYGAKMPKNDSAQTITNHYQVNPVPFSQTQLDLLANWITQGAKNN